MARTQAVNAVRRLGADVAARIFRTARQREEIAPKPEEPESPKDILYQNGKPIGTSGKKPDVRIEKGGEKGAKDLYDKLSKGGEPHKPENYPPEAEGTKLPNGDWVGYRPVSRSGSPTIDLKIEGVPFDKIHFLE